MPSTTTSRRGRVVVVSVPFTDQSGRKLRPAVVVSSEGFGRRLPDLIVCPISSQPRYLKKPGPGDRPLSKWKTAGLRYPSTVRVSKVLSIEKSLISRSIGKLAAEDLAAVDSALRTALGL